MEFGGIVFRSDQTSLASVKNMGFVRIVFVKNFFWVSSFLVLQKGAFDPTKKKKKKKKVRMQEDEEAENSVDKVTEKVETLAGTTGVGPEAFNPNHFCFCKGYLVCLVLRVWVWRIS
jgi:hypothetical protein